LTLTKVQPLLAVAGSGISHGNGVVGKNLYFIQYKSAEKEDSKNKSTVSSMFVLSTASHIAIYFSWLTILL
jgi:hypothetical protein